MNTVAKIGEQVVCVDAPHYVARKISRGTYYVVNGTTETSNNGAIYYKILGDDNSGHWLLSSLFAHGT